MDILREALQEILDGGDARQIAWEALNGSYCSPSDRATEGQVRGLQQIAAAAFGFSRHDLVACRNDKPTSQARKLAMWLCREHLALSWAAAGRMFGRDPTTIRKACADVACYPEKYLRGSRDERLRRLVIQISERESAAAVHDGAAAAQHSNTPRYGGDTMASSRVIYNTKSEKFQAPATIGTLPYNIKPVCRRRGAESC